MVSAYVPETRNTNSPPSLTHSDLTMAIGGASDATVPETVSTPSPPATADVIEEPATITNNTTVTPLDDDAIPHEGPSVETGEPVFRLGTDAIPLPYRMDEPDPVIVKPEELTEEEYIAKCLQLMMDFKPSGTDWVHRAGPPIPVAEGQPLDEMLRFCGVLALSEKDVEYPQCVNFYQETMGLAFTKLLSDDNLSSWSQDVYMQLYRRCEQAIELVAMKLHCDYLGMLDLLTLMLNPTHRFISCNSSRHSVKFPTIILPPSRTTFGIYPSSSTSDLTKTSGLKTEEDVIPPDVYARCFDNRSPRGILVDLLNAFGQAGGFEALRVRIEDATEANPLTISLLVALLKPIGLCYEYLTKTTVERFFLRIFEIVPHFLETMSDEEFKKESGKQDGKSDPVSTILRSLKSLAKVVPEQSPGINQVIETTRLSAIIKLLRVSTYNGKMHALNEINRIIQGLSYTHRPFSDDDVALGTDKVAKWLQENRVLSVILADSMHQPQYVEKLEKIIRFMVREKSLTVPDLDDLWNAQDGKHEAIVKNVHDLLTKLAWDFTPEQLDHLFSHFQGSWVSASRRQREKLLELIRRLAEDDKEGVMAVKVLELLWSLCHNEELPTEIMDLALAAHLKILDYNCSHDRDSLKLGWLKRCVDEIRRNVWVVPALGHIRNICEQFPENLNSHSSMSGISHIRNSMLNRNEVMKILINDHHAVTNVVSSLEQYLDQVRHVQQNDGGRDFDPLIQDLLGSKYPHFKHVDSRLNFLQFLLRQGNVFLEHPEKLWACLVENPAVEVDRDLGFTWFNKIMTSEQPDLDPEYIKNFYETKVLGLSPSHLTESGIQCFKCFLRFVNTKEGKLEFKRKQHYLQQYELLGIDYLWKVILTCREDIAQLGIDILRDLYAFPSQKMLANIVTLHKDVIGECIDQLRPIHDNLAILDNDKDFHNKIQQDANKAVRILKVIIEYIQQYDKDYTAERAKPPLSKATYGRGISVLVKIPSNNRPGEDAEIFVHSNETVGSMRRSIYQKYHLSPAQLKLDLSYNNEFLQPVNDRRLVSDLGLDAPGRDRPIITVKFGAQFSGVEILADMVQPSSPESSNDVSPVDTPHGEEETNLDLEKQLPGVWVAQEPDYLNFFIRLADLGSRLNNKQLLDTSRELLDILPANESVLATIRGVPADPSITLDALFHVDSPSKVLYNLQVLQSILLPARTVQFEDAVGFCRDLILRRDVVEYILGMLTRNNFLQNADIITKQQCYQCILRLVRMVLYIMFGVGLEVEMLLRSRALPTLHQYQGPRRGFTDDTLRMIGGIKPILHHSVTDLGVRQIGLKVSQLWREGPVSLPSIDICKALRHLAWTAASGSLNLLGCPEEDARSALQKRTSHLDLADVIIAEEALDCLLLCIPLTPRSLEHIMEPSQRSWLVFFQDMVLVCRNAGIRHCAMGHFRHLGVRCSSEHVPLDVVMVNWFFGVVGSQTKNRPETSGEVFSLLSALLSNFNPVTRPLKDVDKMLSVELDWLADIRRTCMAGGRQSINDVLLEGHLMLLKDIIRCLSPHKKAVVKTKDGHVPLIRELIEDFLFPTAKILLKIAHNQRLGTGTPQSSSPDGMGISSSASTNDLFDAAYSDSPPLLDAPTQSRAICQTSAAITAAFEVIVYLCIGSEENLNLLNDTLTLLFYSDKESPINEWEYSPPVGPRRSDGFVGLKNAGATCYMNSVLQQLYMIPSIRNGLLSVDGIGNNYSEEDAEEKGDGDVTAFVGPLLPFCGSDENIICGDHKKEEPEVILPLKSSPIPDYNVGLIKNLQIIFSHLACSKLQFYIPRGFWKHFRLGNEPVNLREQHDALEFYNQLVDGVDEGLKSMKKPALMGQVLSGTFADQKICRDCPHRYSREESFTSLSLDIRNFHTLQDALEHYVKGDLLEGANAYFCEKCQRKVDTMKRLCIKRLPPILTIQLKRFDYDWEREQPIKFNDYFEFPRLIDMEPYTAAGLAEMERQTIPDEDDIIQAFQEANANCSAGIAPSKRPQKPNTQYRLVGVVVHSGQASAGHYYSYILDRDGGEAKWQRFDDGDVTECKMDDDEEMKAQCFGGEQPQKRWWNAYILFYERVDLSSQLNRNFQQRERSSGRTRMYSESIGAQVGHMIPQNLRSVIMKQNQKFLHNRSQFLPEYFAFLKRLLMMCTGFLVPGHQDSSISNRNQQAIGIAKSSLTADESEACAVAIVKLLGKFIFDVCFRTRRNLRGAAHDWSEYFIKILTCSVGGRLYFTEHILFKTQRRLFEYLVECPSSDIRTAFSRLLAHMAYFGMEDNPCPFSAIKAATNAGYKLRLTPSSLGELILMACMELMSWKEMSDHARQIGSYFNVFQLFATSGAQQRAVLVKLGVSELFIHAALDDPPYGIFKYNSGSDVHKLYSIISVLVRSTDFAETCRPLGLDERGVPALAPNPFVEGQLVGVPERELVMLLVGSNNFLRKLMEDAIGTEDVRNMIKYLSWECPDYTIRVLATLLNALSAQYLPDVKVLLDFAFVYIQMNDSWLLPRCTGFLTASEIENAEGFLSIMTRNRTGSPRRAYLFFKYLVHLMNTGTPAAAELINMLSMKPDSELYVAYTDMCEWLHGELDHGRSNYFNGPSHQTYYHPSASFHWNNQPASNETSNGSHFERTNTARATLSKAMEFLPEEADFLLVCQATSSSGVEDDEEDDDNEAVNFNADEAAAEASSADMVVKPAVTQHRMQNKGLPSYDPTGNWGVGDDLPSASGSATDVPPLIEPSGAGSPKKPNATGTPSTVFCERSKFILDRHGQSVGDLSDNKSFEDNEHPFPSGRKNANDHKSDDVDIGTMGSLFEDMNIESEPRESVRPCTPVDQNQPHDMNSLASSTSSSFQNSNFPRK